MHAVDKKKTFSERFLRNKYKRMSGYEDFVKSIGINFHFRVNKDTKMLDYRDLTGPEILTFFRNITISSLLPRSKENEPIQVIWDDFMALIGDLKLDYTPEDSILILKTKFRSWFEKFLKCIKRKM